MKILFASSYYGKSKYEKNYIQVQNEFRKLDVEVMTVDSGKFLTILKLQNYAKTHNKKNLNYEFIRRGIEWANLVIFETSHEDFQLGYLTNVAIQNRKPVLCLSIHEDFSAKIKSPFFMASKYNEKSIEGILVAFIDKNKKESLSQRFNLFLSPRQLESLEKSAKSIGLNNSEYLRLLLDNN